MVGWQASLNCGVPFLPWNDQHASSSSVLAEGVVKKWCE